MLQSLPFQHILQNGQVCREVHALGSIQGIQLIFKCRGNGGCVALHLRADGGGILAPHPLLCQLGILLQHVHGIGQIVDRCDIDIDRGGIGASVAVGDGVGVAGGAAEAGVRGEAQAAVEALGEAADEAGGVDAEDGECVTIGVGVAVGTGSNVTARV